MENILAVDIGTTSAKALVVNDRGEVLARFQEYYPTQHPQTDFAEQDPHEIFQAVKRVIREAAKQVAGQVHGVSFSSAMHSLMLVEANGVALTPLLTWADLRSTREARALQSSVGQGIYIDTGTPIHPMSPLCKLIWMKRNQPDLFKRAARFVGIKEFIWFQLFRTFAIDHSIASATGLFDSRKLSWSPKALDAAALSPASLSSPCSVYTVFRNPAPHLAGELGVPENIPWVIGASDGCLANLGSGAMDEKVLSLTVGTSGAVRRLARTIHPDPEGRIFHYLLDESRIIEGGATNNGAVLVKWFSEKILRQPVDIKLFAERSSTVAAGADGLIFLPYVLGERAPIFDPDAAGVFFGVREHHTTEHFMRAILEGIGYALFSIANVMPDHGQPCEKIVASGGFTQSGEWVQLMSHIFGKEFSVRGSDDASAMGAAIMGFKAIGKEVDFKFPEEQKFYPDKALHLRYQQYFTIYKDLYPKLSDSFYSLGKLTNA